MSALHVPPERHARGDHAEVELDDDLVSRARRHAETHPESRELIEELLAGVEPAWQSLERCADSLASFIRDHGDPGTEALAAIYEARQVLLRRPPTPTPPPVPPWPGAVLSGLTDEDGVPTWLAQAGQVRGEQVRLRHLDDEWATWATLDGDQWVEVRAPRAVPVPETERVPWWEALGRLGLAGDPFVEVGSGDEGPWVRVVEGGTKLYSPVAPDGTVEVLKDGES